MKNNLLKGLIVIIMGAIAISISSCKSGKGNQEAKTEIAYSVDSLLNNADTLINKEVEVKGFCSHICAHGGGKIFLTGSDDQKIIRIEAGESIGSFKPETVNCIVIAKGKLIEDRIDEAYLAEWESKLKTSEKHGNSEAGCSAEKAARNEKKANSANERIENFRKQIAERESKEGKNYLSFYHIEATSYEIADK